MIRSRHLVASGALLALALAARTAAAAEGGWVVAHDPTNASYAPLPAFSWNSAGGAITVTRAGTGWYKVLFAGLGATQGGTVTTSAISDSHAYCTVVPTGPTGTAAAPMLTMTIKCYAPNGTAMDSKFAATFTLWTDSTPANSAYVWDDLLTSSATPNFTYQWNSAGGFFNSMYQGSPPGSYLLLKPGPLVPNPKVATFVSAYGGNGTGGSAF